MEKLSKQELEGVIAHEMSHIANYDVRFMTLTAILVGLISITAQIFLRSLWFSHGGSENKKSGAIILIVAIVASILAPLLAHLVSLAISRKREFTADATAVKFTRYPPGLADALKKKKNTLRQSHLFSFPTLSRKKFRERSQPTPQSTRELKNWRICRWIVMEKKKR